MSLYVKSTRMSCYPPTRRVAPAIGRRNRLRHLLATALGFLVLAPAALGQTSIATAVDLALRGNPRVQMAQADVAKAHDMLSQLIDAYIPALDAGAGLGQSYGYSPQPPTLFTINAGSLIYNGSQSSYIRAARTGVSAAQLALDDTRETVAEETALAFLALDFDKQREQVTGQQDADATTLVSIAQDRFNAGQDAEIDLTQAKLTAAQLHLAMLKAQDDIAVDRDHLARLIGQPARTLRIDSNLPPNPSSTGLEATITTETAAHGYANSAIASAFANAKAKQEQARGDSRFRFIPQINLFGQYNYYATYSNSFAQLQKIYQENTGQTTLSSSEGAFGVQITLPLLDRAHSAKARQSIDDAAHALHAAQSLQLNALDTQTHLRHSIVELQAQAEVARLQQQLAQQQLKILSQQLQSGTGNPNGPRMTPEDEQKARIAERDKYLLVIDAGYQLRQAEIHLLRQTGGLFAWLKSTSAPPPASSQLPALPAPISAPRQNLPASPEPQP